MLSAHPVMFHLRVQQIKRPQAGESSDVRGQAYRSGLEIFVE